METTKLKTKLDIAHIILFHKRFAMEAGAPTKGTVHFWGTEKDTRGDRDLGGPKLHCTIMHNIAYKEIVIQTDQRTGLGYALPAANNGRQSGGSLRDSIKSIAMFSDWL